VAEPTELEEREWFCPQCGVRAERYCIDEDGCCASCGATCCRLSELRALLAKAGLHLVPEADKRATDAVVELAREVAALHDQGEHSPQLTERLAIAIAQLDGEDDG
jgi:hypothetical protein